MSVKRKLKDKRTAVYTLSDAERQEVMLRRITWQRQVDVASEAQTLARMAQESHDRYLQDLARDHDLPTKYELDLNDGNVYEAEDG